MSCFKLSAQTEFSYLDCNYQDCKKKNAAYLLEITKDKDSITKKIKNIATDKTIVIYKSHKKNKEAVYSYNFDGMEYITNEGLFISSKKEGEWIYYNSKHIITKRVVYEKDIVTIEKYMDSGHVSMEIPYSEGRYHGESKIYFKGILVKKVTFENGFMVKKEDLLTMDSINDNDSVPKLRVEIMPSFVGGESEMMNFIAKNLNYPKKAVDSGIEGKIVVKFTCDKMGKVKDAHIISKDKLGYGCEEEALRVIRNMPRWNAGLQNGVPVNVYFNIPIRFRLF